MESLGICIGASTVSFVTLRKTKGAISLVSSKTVEHNGNPKSVLDRFKAYKGKRALATGRKFKDILNLPSISEPEALESAFQHHGFKGRYHAIASLGGETFMAYEIDDEGHITNVITGNKCASGTGEFFLQQIRRMDVTVKQAVELALKNKAHKVSGRCSVFCKSDCTHALNKGIPVGEVTAGLCSMISEKIVELLSQQDSDDVLVIGGVSKNKAVTNFLRKSYPKMHIPKSAPCFEAYGAALQAFVKGSQIPEELFRENESNFTFLPELRANQDNVEFKDIKKAKAGPGDPCILGLDVGSTTTKAVLLRERDNAIVASVYLRTNGNPVNASVECYKAIASQIKPKISIRGLGVTGSGRHIAGLHALTEGVVNEIIAHARASAYFDPEVDTIFEIGGQDAKYTYLTNGVASDYAMNEACSAGTGSFLEESAQESLKINYRKIAQHALNAKRAPNFNDQCAAFISSDVKHALQEGIGKDDVVAGLVYSICMNYVNRVKGNRPVGKKVFMQGGVCYNKAVPVAMSVLVGKKIIVPPEPGLMGAFGVALEIKERLNLGLMKEQAFDLKCLISRSFSYKNRFICKGGKEACDLGCEITVVEVEGRNYPFGGACSRYYNQRLNQAYDTESHDYVKRRQDLVFKKYIRQPNRRGKKIGISRSFLTNSLFPLFYNFFNKLGYRVVLADKVEPEGVKKLKSSFCYPVEISHGLFQDLINKKVDYIFLPHVTEMNNPSEKTYKRTCVFVQSEGYYLKSAFKDTPPLLQPVLDFARKGQVSESLLSLAQKLGKGKADARKAYAFAKKMQDNCSKDMHNLGIEALEEVKSSGKTGIVVFGRPYNAFAREANMGIPHKFASKGYITIPHDILPTKGIRSNHNMYWYMGQVILRNARFIKKHDNLFGAFITNFSCGPDSFVVPYFRRIMGTKPSLTLELDSHSSDAGIETRVDAALDIIKSYQELKKLGRIPEEDKGFRQLTVQHKGRKVYVMDSDGRKYSLKSREVEVIVPSMGRFGTQALAATLRNNGINAVGLSVPTFESLKLGRANTSCKECLPYILTTGQMIEYLKDNKGKKYLFFMPHGHGPCRQGQYHIRLMDLINDLKLEDAGVLSLNDENSYGNMGIGFFLRGWICMIISDAMQDIENAIQALSDSPREDLQILEEEWKRVLARIERGTTKSIFNQLEIMSKALAQLGLQERYRKAMKVSIIGEVYVRREEFSRLDLIDQLSKKGFVAKVAPITEYIYYCSYLMRTGLRRHMNDKKGLKKTNYLDRKKAQAKEYILVNLESRLKRILAKSGLYEHHLVDIDDTVGHSRHLISKELLGESILTTGLALKEIIDDSSGIISIGPFACMPSRVAESILNVQMTRQGKEKSSNRRYDTRISKLPYLHVETDGNPYPQLIQSRLEIFMLQARRLHNLTHSQE